MASSLGSATQRVLEFDKQTDFAQGNRWQGGGVVCGPSLGQFFLPKWPLFGDVAARSARNPGLAHCAHVLPTEQFWPAQPARNRRMAQSPQTSSGSVDLGR